MKRALRRAKYAELIKMGEMIPSTPSDSRKEFLVEAYKKHSAELASIEGGMSKLDPATTRS